MTAPPSGQSPFNKHHRPADRLPARDHALQFKKNHQCFTNHTGPEQETELLQETVSSDLQIRMQDVHQSGLVLNVAFQSPHDFCTVYMYRVYVFDIELVVFYSVSQLPRCHLGQDSLEEEIMYLNGNFLVK